MSTFLSVICFVKQIIFIYRALIEAGNRFFPQVPGLMFFYQIIDERSDFRVAELAREVERVEAVRRIRIAAIQLQGKQRPARNVLADQVGGQPGDTLS